MSATGQNVSDLKIATPASTTPEYLGDLEEDSSLPFNIPLSTGNKSSSGNYLVPLKVEYYDDLRNQYIIYEIDVVTLNLAQQPVGENQGVGSLFSTSNQLGLIILVVVLLHIVDILVS